MTTANGTLTCSENPHFLPSLVEWHHCRREDGMSIHFCAVHMDGADRRSKASFKNRPRESTHFAQNFPYHLPAHGAERPARSATY